MAAFQLLQVTDPHLFADESQQVYGIDTAESLRLVLEAALGDGPPPDAIVVTGDIGDDLSPEAYARFRRLLAHRGAPVHCLPGNHDDPTLMARLLDDRGFQYCSRARFGQWGAVLIDTHIDGEPSGRIRAEELARLDADLRALGDGPALVCMHHPPLPIGSAWLDAVGLQDRGEFLAVIDRHPQVRLVLAGHVHQAFDALRGRVRVLATPSTCAQFTPGTVECVMDQRPPGYRWLSLHADGTLETRVGWLPAMVGTPRAEDESRR